MTRTEILIGLGLLALLGLAGYALWRFPCLETRAYACERTACVYWMHLPKGGTICTTYRHYPSRCTECMRRGDRLAGEAL